MKKTIRKPENWQDFESLCKKLWGEVWEISSKIKKNGRIGQPQAGVDVYGKPKGETNYWGIQCKGKDDYINSKLTKKRLTQKLRKQSYSNQNSMFSYLQQLQTRTQLLKNISESKILNTKHTFLKYYYIAGRTLQT